MKSIVQKWGNSLAVRIPKSFADEIKLSQGSEIDLVLLKNKIQIEPIKEEKPSLDELVGKITKENIHKELDSGPPVGKEIW